MGLQRKCKKIYFSFTSDADTQFVFQMLHVLNVKLPEEVRLSIPCYLPCCYSVQCVIYSMKFGDYEHRLKYISNRVMNGRFTFREQI